MVWRQDSLLNRQLVGNYDSISQGWFKLTHPAIGNITAMSISKTPANILYVGTTNNKIHKFIDVQTGNPNFTNISSTDFHGAVSCIALHPHDANKVLAVFSNYHVYSLWYSEDGGAAWKKVAGNLEQYPDGSGNGPSCRWASILPVGNRNLYFVGTSTGLFATDTLIADSTVWTGISTDLIGNVVVDMVETREADGLVVVGTHGNGIYSIKVNSVNDILGKTEDRDCFVSNPIVYPNPATDKISIDLKLARPVKTTISMYDIQGRLVEKFDTEKNINALDVSHYRAGKYFCRMEAAGRKKTLSWIKL
jgi:hypothetical protein